MKLMKETFRTYISNNLNRLLNFVSLTITSYHQKSLPQQKKIMKNIVREDETCCYQHRSLKKCQNSVEIIRNVCTKITFFFIISVIPTVYHCHLLQPLTQPKMGFSFVEKIVNIL